MFSRKDIYKITFPLILQQIFAVTISMVDSVMVASAGEDAVAGVSLIGVLDTVLVLLFSSLVAGGTVVTAHTIGQGNENKIKDSVKQVLYLSTFIALIVLLIVQTLGDPILTLLYGNAEKVVLNHSHNYFSIISVSYPFMAIQYSCAASFRAMGKTSSNLIISIVENLINVAGNALFIYAFDLEAVGAALGTVIARFAGMVIWLAMLHNKTYPVRIEHIFHYRPNREMIREILRIGIPGGVENCMFQFGRLLTQSLISTLGTTAIAANSVALNLANYQYIPGAAIGNAAVTVIGRAVGAGKKEQAQKYAHTMLMLAYICLWTANLATVLFCRPLVGMYQLSAASAEIAHLLLILHSAVGAVLWPIGFFLPHVFRSAGDVRLTAVISPLSVWVFRVALGYFLTLEHVTVFGIVFPGLGLGIYGVWTAMFIDWVFRCSFYLPHYLRKKWLKQT